MQYRIFLLAATLFASGCLDNDSDAVREKEEYLPDTAFPGRIE